MKKTENFVIYYYITGHVANLFYKYLQRREQENGSSFKQPISG